jgi:hypothetical protein
MTATGSRPIELAIEPANEFPNEDPNERSL